MSRKIISLFAPLLVCLFFNQSLYASTKFPRYELPEGTGVTTAHSAAKRFRIFYPDGYTDAQLQRQEWLRFWMRVGAPEKLTDKDEYLIVMPFQRMGQENANKSMEFTKGELHGL